MISMIMIIRGNSHTELTSGEGICTARLDNHDDLGDWIQTFICIRCERDLITKYRHFCPNTIRNVLLCNCSALFRVRFAKSIRLHTKSGRFVD